MRIALLTYSTRARGGVVHTLSLAEHLSACGEDVTVWTLGRGGDGSFFRAVDPAVRLQVVPFPELAGESVGARVLRSIRVLGEALAGEADDYDVVHAQDCISANAAGAFGRSYLRTVHHLDTFTTPELAACHQRAICEPSGHFCVSAAVAAELQDGWGIDATVIPNGVDAARFSAAAGPDAHALAARELWRNRLGRYVLAVGGIEPRKGTVDLVAAMATVQSVDPDLQLVIAGGETLFDYREYRRDVDATTRELGVRMHVLGPVDNDLLPSLVAAAEAFAFPSTKEGFGLAAMEALAAGVPVVARDLPVLREVFGSAVTYGRDPAELAELLLAARFPSPDRESIGRALATRFTWSAAAEAHVSRYTELGSLSTSR